MSNNSAFHRIDYIKITIFGFALTAMWSSLHTFILPLRVLDFVAESQKNTCLGLLTFAGLILAMLVQPIAGAISDRWGFNWGRRRPYILAGTALVILLLPGIGLANSFITLLIVYCLLQISSNTAQGPFQAFIPDLVPGKKRGVASGVKGLLEIAGGLVLLAIFIGRYLVGEGSLWLWSSLSLLDVVLLGALLATIFMVKERPWTGGSPPPLLPTIYKSFKIDVKVSPGFVTFLVSRLLIIMAMATLQTFALYFLIDVVGITDLGQVTGDLLILAGICLIVAGICLIGVVYLAGWLSDRIGRRPVVIASGLLGALGILPLLFIHNNYSALMVSGALLAISGGAFFSSNWALATDLVPKGEEARYLGLTNLATAGGAALARLIGIAIDPLNAYSHGLGYQVMLTACLVYFIVGSVLLFRIKEPANRGNSAAPPTP
ncbi:MAG: MFS transporter [Deltaproteobacteria bacterium]|nr:MFS transporter [Deltaproteobacteria bacterium]